MSNEDRGLTPLVIEWRTAMRAEGLSARTVEARMQLMRRFIMEAASSPESATPQQIIDWFASYDGTAGRALWSQGTRRTHHANLAAWFSWLVRQDHRADDPMVKVRAPRLPRYEAHPPADEHLPRLLATAMRKRTKAMIYLAAYAGLRVHEIAKFRGEDIDTVGMTLMVKGKGGTVRRLPLAVTLAQLADTMPHREWWFPSRDVSGHVQARSVSAVVSAVMRRAGVPGTAHSLRHWYASSMVEQDVDLRTVQELLRHANMATTQIYTKVSDARMRDAVNKLDMMRAVRQPAA